jgi:uncharacterized membrane protein YphA (DoxX/SURF4 family)
MPVVLLGVRLLLATVFFAAGVGKLRDRSQFVATLSAMGVGRGQALPLATVIPCIELLTGAALLHFGFAAAGAIASLLMLAVFTAVTIISVWQGKALDCACFGSRAAEPLGLATLIRNAALMFLAILLVVAGPGAAITSSGPAWNTLTPDARALAALSLVFLVALAATTVHASRLHAAHARLASRVDLLEQRSRPTLEGTVENADAGLPPGARAPSFDLPRLEGDRASLASLLTAGEPVALVFLSAHCPACHELWSDIERWQSSDVGAVTVAAVCSGSPQTFELKLMGHTVMNVLLEGDTQVTEAYRISSRPAAVIVAPDGTIASGTFIGTAAVRALIGAHV